MAERYRCAFVKTAWDAVFRAPDDYEQPFFKPPDEFIHLYTKSYGGF